MKRTNKVDLKNYWIQSHILKRQNYEDSQCISGCSQRDSIGIKELIFHASDMASLPLPGIALKASEKALDVVLLEWIWWTLKKHCILVALNYGPSYLSITGRATRILLGFYRELWEQWN